MKNIFGYKTRLSVIVFCEESSHNGGIFMSETSFYKDIDTCKNFSEIRIHPDLVAQPCIMKDETYPIDIQKDSEQIINQLNDIGKNFTSC